MTTQHSDIQYTHRTKNGRKARILTTNRVGKSKFPVIALVLHADGVEWVEAYTSDLKYHNVDQHSDYDLVEWSPWNDVAIDTPILVKDRESDSFCHRHFAGYHHGKVYTWSLGQTSWSIQDDVSDHMNYKTGWAIAVLPEDNNR